MSESTGDVTVVSVRKELRSALGMTLLQAGMCELQGMKDQLHWIRQYAKQLLAFGLNSGLICETEYNEWMDCAKGKRTDHGVVWMQWQEIDDGPSSGEVEAM